VASHDDDCLEMVSLTGFRTGRERDRWIDREGREGGRRRRIFLLVCACCHPFIPGHLLTCVTYTPQPSCYSSMRKGMRPIDSEMRRNRFKDTAHVLFSPPSKSAAPSEGDVLAGGATLPTSGGTPLPTSGGTPIPHTGFTPGQGCNFSPSTFLLTSPSANVRFPVSPRRLPCLLSLSLCLYLSIHSTHRAIKCVVTPSPSFAHRTVANPSTTHLPKGCNPQQAEPPHDEITAFGPCRLGTACRASGP